MIYGQLPMLVLIMVSHLVGTPMLLTTPLVPRITTVGPKVLAAIQGGGGQPIEGGKGVGEDRLNDRPS